MEKGNLAERRRLPVPGGDSHIPAPVKLAGWSVFVMQNNV